MTRTKQKKMAERALAILVVVVFCFLVYGISRLGAVVARRLVIPAMRLTGTGEMTGTTVTVDQLDVYVVGVGSYTSTTDAQKHKDTVTASGGAGYITKTDSGYTVAASAYGSKDWADSVKDKLTALGCSASVVCQEAPEIRIKVTASDENAKAVEKCLTTLRSSVETMLSLCVETDKGDVTRAQACGTAAGEEDALTDALKSLKGLSCEGQWLTNLTKMLQTGRTALGEMPSSDDNDFGRKMKACTVTIATEYVHFAQTYTSS